MGWMKLDDSFHASRKLNSIPKRQRLAAAGLWAIAGSWVADQETDGFVPEYMIQVWGGTPKVVDALVNAGLWRRESRTNRSDCDVESSGFVFDSWLEYNPSRSDSERRRALDRERKSRAREEKAKKRAGHKAASENVRAESSDTVPVESKSVSAERPLYTDPTRPDPIKKEHLRALAQPAAVERVPAPEPPPAKRAKPAAYPAAFEEFWAAYPRRTGKRNALGAWQRARDRVGEEAVLDGAKRLAADPNLPEARFVPHPATWLNRDGWDDEPLPQRNGGDQQKQGRVFGTRPEDWDAPAIQDQAPQPALVWPDNPRYGREIASGR